MKNSNVLSIQDWRSNLSPDGGVDDSNMRMDEEEGSLEILNPDGSAVVVFNPQPSRRHNDDHYENLAESISESDLGLIASDLVQGIDADEQSRSEWLSTRAKGLDLLGLKIEAPRADVGGSGAPMDGMSTVRHPLLLEACLRFQANALGELLPASGPVKIKNNGLGAGKNDVDADQLEEDMNRYLTSYNGAPEYYPDTDRMLFSVGFSGMGFKKLYHCPLRRRPVSESVDAKDLIVSNDATDIRNAARVTHRINMRKSVMRRMQFVGAYRRVELGMPTPDVNRVDQKIKKMQGIDPTPQRPQDNEYVLYETYADLDIPGLEHVDEDGIPTGLQLPYKVTIDKSSRKILEIRRNWNAEDEDFKARRVFVAYNFVPMFGFYASGLLQILGNTTTAITGAWRMLLDTGMFANFPGFLYALNGDRQTDLNFRVPPGGGAGVDIAGSEDIRQKVMPLPYQSQHMSALQALTSEISSTGQRVGGTAEIQIGEGRQDAPVGTTIALLEQAAKTMDAVHKRLHQAQSEEFQILLELFREDPDAFFRFVKKDGRWTQEGLTAALGNYELQPVADPNVPTHMHRIMTMTALKQLADASPDLYNKKAVDERILRSLRIENPEDLFATPDQMQAAQAPADPATIIAQSTLEAKKADIAARERIAAADNQIKVADIAAKAKLNETQNQIKAAQIAAEDRRAREDRASREYVAKVNLAGKVATKDMDMDMQQANQVIRSNQRAV